MLISFRSLIFEVNRYFCSTSLGVTQGKDVKLKVHVRLTFSDERL